jgi:hypothetical protein
MAITNSMINRIKQICENATHPINSDLRRTYRKSSERSCKDTPINLLLSKAIPALWKTWVEKVGSQ